VVPSPTAAFTINPILSTDPTVALRPPTIGPIKQSNTSLTCWPQLDPTVTAKQRRPPHRSFFFLFRIATLSPTSLRIDKEPSNSFDSPIAANNPDHALAPSSLLFNVEVVLSSIQNLRI
jgi:hypothetical protein